MKENYIPAYEAVEICSRQCHDILAVEKSRSHTATLNPDGDALPLGDGTLHLCEESLIGYQLVSHILFGKNR